MSDRKPARGARHGVPPPRARVLRRGVRGDFEPNQDLPVRSGHRCSPSVLRGAGASSLPLGSFFVVDRDVAGIIDIVTA